MRVVLEIMQGPDTGQKCWLQGNGAIKIGRTQLADFAVSDDPEMSGIHFEIRSDSQTCLVRDLGSTNGTFLNNQRITNAVVSDGVSIRAGRTVFTVSIEQEQTPRSQAAVTATQLRQSDVPDPVVAPHPPSATPIRLPSQETPQRTVPVDIRDTFVSESREEQQIVLPGQSPGGQHIMSVLLKRTYNIVPGGICTRAEKDAKLNPADVFYDDPMNSTVQFESDFIPFKLATDVVLNGKAYSPGGVPIQSLTASLMVGQYRKDLHVIGNRTSQFRTARSPQFTDPAPFESMELRYEKSFGGIDVFSDFALPAVYPRNHLGCGFIVKNCKQAVDKRPLPNIEDPNDLLTPDRLCVGDAMEWAGQPMPQGFGWYAKSWYPRALLAGVMPADRLLAEELHAMYATVVPEEQKELHAQTKLRDMDFEFFNGASADLAVPFLAGNEMIRTTNLSPEGQLDFQLPGESFAIGLDIGQGVQDSEVVLQTVMIRMEDKQVDLVWRSCSPYPGPDWLPEMATMEVAIQ